MPVILEHENVALWLSGQSGTELLDPAAEEKVSSWPVSTRVNKTGSADGATFIDNVAQSVGSKCQNADCCSGLIWRF